LVRSPHATAQAQKPPIETATSVHGDFVFDFMARLPKGVCAKRSSNEEEEDKEEDAEEACAEKEVLDLVLLVVLLVLAVVVPTLKMPDEWLLHDDDEPEESCWGRISCCFCC
jgi:hypothetical protein